MLQNSQFMNTVYNLAEIAADEEKLVKYFPLFTPPSATFFKVCGLLHRNYTAVNSSQNLLNSNAISLILSFSVYADLS